MIEPVELGRGKFCFLRIDAEYLASANPAMRDRRRGQSGRIVRSEYTLVQHDATV